MKTLVSLAYFSCRKQFLRCLQSLAQRLSRYYALSLVVSPRGRLLSTNSDFFISLGIWSG